MAPFSQYYEESRHQWKGNEFYDSPPHWNPSQQLSNISKIKSETFKDEPHKVYARLLQHTDPHQ